MLETNGKSIKIHIFQRTAYILDGFLKLAVHGKSMKKRYVLKDSLNFKWAPDAGNPWNIDKSQCFLKNPLHFKWAPDAGSPWQIDKK